MCVGHKIKIVSLLRIAVLFVTLCDVLLVTVSSPSAFIQSRVEV